jgi:hypothetical protein
MLGVSSGVLRHQTGDHEMRALFPPEALEQVASVIRAYRKPGLSSRTAKRVGAKTAFGGTSRSQKTRVTAGSPQDLSDSLKSCEEA